MSTDNLDNRLHAAGQRWRAANDTPASVDLTRLDGAEPVDVPITPTPLAAPPRWGLRSRVVAAVGACAAVAATIVAVQLGTGSGSTHHPAPAVAPAGVQVVCQPTGPASAAQLNAAAAVITKRLTQAGTASGTVTVEGSDSLVITVPGGTDKSTQGLCAQARLDLRPLVMPAAVVAPGAATRSNDPFAGLTFAVPTSEQGFDRLDDAEQAQLRAALTQVDCAAAASRPRPAAAPAPGCETRNDGSTVAYLLGPALVAGTDIAGAAALEPNVSRALTQWTVSLTFTPSAQATWAKYTRAHHTGGSRTSASAAVCGSTGTPCAYFVAASLDGNVLSAAVNEDVISGSTSTQITGNFTQASATALAARLSIGPLPVPLRLVSTTPLHTNRPLVGTNWQLVTISRPGGAPLAVTAPLMIDGAGQLTGTDGCNALSAHVTITGHTIKFGSVETTLRACVPKVAGFAAQVAYLDSVLTGSLQWSITGDELTLSKDGSAALIYRAQADAPPSSVAVLVGTPWQLTGFTTPAGTNSTPLGTARLQFDGKGGVVGSNGCYPFSGPVMITAAHLKFGALGTTGEVLCSSKVGAQLTAIGAVLSGVSWSIKDGVLTLTKPGAGSLTYKQAPANVAPKQPASGTASH